MLSVGRPTYLLFGDGDRDFDRLPEQNSINAAQMSNATLMFKKAPTNQKANHKESSQKVFPIWVFRSTFTLTGILHLFSVEMHFKQLSSANRKTRGGIKVRLCEKQHHRIAVLRKALTQFKLFISLTEKFNRTEHQGTKKLVLCWKQQRVNENPETGKEHIPKSCRGNAIISVISQRN